MQNPPGHANRLDGVGLPGRKVQNVTGAEHVDHALFLAVTPYCADLHMAIPRLVPGWKCLEGRCKAWLVGFDLQQRLAASCLHRLDGLDLAMHRIGGAQHTCQTKFTHQRLHGRYFIALCHDGDVAEDDLRAHGKSPEQVGHLLLMGRVVAAFEALAVVRDHLSWAAAEGRMLHCGMPAEHRFQAAAVHQADDPPQRRWRRCALHL